MRILFSGSCFVAPYLLTLATLALRVMSLESHFLFRIYEDFFYLFCNVYTSPGQKDVAKDQLQNR